MANWTATGAGTPAANGLYEPVGEIDGKPSYENENGVVMRWYALANRWSIGDAASVGTNYYRGEVGVADLPAGTWVVWAGQAPVPTIEEVAAAAPLIRRFNPRLVATGMTPGFMTL